MEREEKLYNRSSCTAARPYFQPPAVPEPDWCDFRRDYESGMTLAAIGEKYYCDPRTVKACIMHNKPSARLGKQSAPTKLEPYCRFIDVCLEKELENRPVQLSSRRSISAVTRDIFRTIKEQGYSGCERTVRNYINAKLPSRLILKKEDSDNDQNCAYGTHDWNKTPGRL